MRGRLTFDGRVKSQQYLSDRRLGSVHQGGDAQLIRPDTVEWRQVPAKYMVDPRHDASTLKGPKIRYFLDNDNEGLIAALISANRAWRLRVNITTGWTRDDLPGGFAKGSREWLEQIGSALQKGKRRLARGPGPEAWQARQKLHQTFDFRACCFARHAARLRFAAVRSAPLSCDRPRGKGHLVRAWMVMPQPYCWLRFQLAALR